MFGMFWRSGHRKVVVTRKKGDCEQPADADGLSHCDRYPDWDWDQDKSMLWPAQCVGSTGLASLLPVLLTCFYRSLSRVGVDTPD